jgi:hypothetical protein
VFRSNIVFDGSLPLAKRAERVSRLGQNNQRVRQLRANYPTDTCPIPTYLGSISHAFLAPALREALVNTQYAPRTSIVAGEADDWCAMHAKENARSIVFTSDTDLLLYDYSPETLIVFFQDADVSAGMKTYAPEQIRQTMQLKSLVQFAYALVQEPTNTPEDIIRRARGLDLESSGYVEFNSRYTGRAGAPQLSKDDGSSLPLDSMDVRVSEFVYQALNESTTPFVYLPLLVEDPNQASAWIMGQEVRTIAYSLLAPHASSIHEYRRKAQVIAVQELNPYTSTTIQTPIADLERHMNGVANWAKSKKLKPQLVWPLYALSVVLAELNTPPPIPATLRALNGEFDSSWAFFQLTARIQSVLYSLRLLAQILKVWLVINASEKPQLREVVSEIDKHLTDFPAIPDMFTVPGQAKKLLAEHDELKGLVEEIYASSGAEVPVEHVSNKKKKRQTREAERKKRKTEQRQRSN